MDSSVTLRWQGLSFLEKKKAFGMVNRAHEQFLSRSRDVRIDVGDVSTLAWASRREPGCILNTHSKTEIRDDGELWVPWLLHVKRVLGVALNLPRPSRYSAH